MIPSLATLTTRLRRRTAAVLAVALAAALPLAVPTAPSAQADDRSATAAAARGYWMVAADGGIFSFGDAKFFGSTGNIKLNKPIVGMAAAPSGNGYWFVASDGGIFSFGDAPFYGSAGNVKLNKPITAMAATPSGKGYWFTASDGGVFSYGDAKFFGAGPERPAKGARTVAAMVPTPDGAGYWQASTTGELLAFGSALDAGGLSGALARPIVGMTAVPGTAAGPTGTTTTQNTTGTTGTTSPTTPTTLPPYTGPMRFSSTALVGSWGTPGDPQKSRINSKTTAESCAAVKGVWEEGSPGQCRVFPYAEKVAAIVEIGDRVYIGGSFTNLHQNNHPRTPTMADPPMEYVAELDTNGIAVPGSAFNATVTFDKPVRTLQRSPDGRRLYVGGEFNTVNGETRRRLVALDPATGQIDRSFNPPEPNAYVSAIVADGSRVYVGGAFATLGGTALPGLAALNLDGSLANGFAPPTRYPGRFEGQAGTKVENPSSGDTTGTVDSLLMTRDGKYLMVGGSFLHFGYDDAADPGHQHSGLIAVDPVTGGLTTWQPEFKADSKSQGSRPVFGMTNYPGDPKAIGINASQLIFTATGGVGGRVIAWTPGGNSKWVWRAGVDGDALGVAATHDRVYLVGHFDYAKIDADDDCLQKVPVSCPDGTPHRHLVAWHASGEIVNGKHTGLAKFDETYTAQANTSEGPYAVALGANRMYVGGNFTEVANAPVGNGSALPVDQPGFAVYPPLQ